MSKTGEWGGMCCSSDYDRRALRSWFPLLDETWTPILADVWEEYETATTPKLRVLFGLADGSLKLAERRQNKRGWVLSIKRPPPSLLKAWRKFWTPARSWRPYAPRRRPATQRYDPNNGCPMTVINLKPTLVEPDSPPTTLAEANALVHRFAAEQARAFEIAVSGLVEFADLVAKSDAAQHVGVVEIARQVAVLNRRFALNLQSLNARKP